MKGVQIVAAIKEISKGGNVVYYINEQNGVVVAKILCDRYEAYDVVESIVRKFVRSDVANSPFDVCFNGLDTDKFNLDEYYTGIAKCSPDDTFNAETGKRIALAKAQAKYHTDINDKLARMSLYFCRISQLIERRAVQEHEQILRYKDEIVNV